MVSSAEDTPRRLTIKKVLYHPLTWTAIGIHLLLLVVPFDPGASTAEPEIEEVTDNEAIPVDILNLSEISTATPPAENVPTPSTPPPSAPSPAAAPPASTAPPAVVAPAPVATAPTDPALAPFEPAPAAAPPASTPPPAYDPGEDQALFINNLGALNLGDYTEAQGLPPANFFRQPGNAGYFLNEGVPVLGAKDARWMDKGPDAVLAELQATYAPSGIVFNQLDSYGGEILYELRTAADQPFMYISLANLKGSSLLVIWQANPHTMGT
ncbi:MAG: hypothetical protein WA885_05320 [Phormidesmis sp.]